MALTGQISLAIDTALTSPLDLSTPKDSLAMLVTQAIADGAGADQANQQWHDEGTIVASGTSILDMAGTLTNAFGATVTLARVKALVLVNTGTVAISVAPSASLGMATMFTGDVYVRPGGFLVLAGFDATGYAVASGVTDRITITNLSGSVSATYKVVVIGATT